jgi:ribosomal protein S18 acetylase RimI-like enzyme
VIELVPALERSLPQLADLQARATVDYAFPLGNDPSELARRLAVDAIDLGASWIAMLHKEDVGFAMIARRGGFSRIDSLGVLPEARKQNVGRSLVDAVLAGGRVHGDLKIVLEVLDDNIPALRLYKSAGFHSWRRLVGWERNHPNVLTKDPSRNVVERPLRHAAWACAHNAERDLPWQFAPESIANLAPPYRAFEHDHSAYCIVRLLDDGTMKVRAFVVRAEARRRGLGSAVLAGACKALGAKRIALPPWCPEGLWDDFFKAAGFHHSKVSQVELRRPIEKAASG